MTNGTWGFPDQLYVSGTRGQYNPLQLVVRLRKEFNEALQRPSSFVTSNADAMVIDAFSTYLHETIHWWQHIGSTLGLLLTFASPMQCHMNHMHLKELLKTIGPRKSLKKVLSDEDALLTDNARFHLNTVINNWHDIEFARRILLDPKRAKGIVNTPFFDSIGHSMSVAFGDMMLLLGWTVDRNFNFLPDPRTWELEFEKLRSEKVVGYYFGSDIRLPVLGAKAIFEGASTFLPTAIHASCNWAEKGVVRLPKCGDAFWNLYRSI